MWYKIMFVSVNYENGKENLIKNMKIKMEFYQKCHMIINYTLYKVHLLYLNEAIVVVIVW
jgi:hypothetical protein